MTSFPHAVGHGLANLGRFAGRDTRSQFWFYMLGLFIAQQALNLVAAIVLMATMFPRFGDGATPPDPATFDIQFNAILIGSLVLGLMALGLVAAAVARRLHDRGLAGWWGAMPVPFALYGSVDMYRIMDGFGTPGVVPDHRQFVSLFINNGVYLLLVLVVVVLLVKESDPAENRFGPPPSP